MEPKDLLGPTATLFAVMFAIASFLFIRALALYRERQKSLSEIDVPDSIRNKKSFKIGIIGDFLFLFLTGFVLFVTAVLYCPTLLYRIANFYVGSPQFSSIDIVVNFRDMSQVILIVSGFLLSVPFVLIASDMFVGRKLPVIVRFFAGNVLGYRLIKKDEAENLLPEAQKLYQSGAFGEAVLYGLASLEIALKNKLSLPPGIGFGRLIVESTDELSAIVPREELVHIRKLRNVAAHPSPERQVTKEEAKKVISVVENLLERLK